ncbi:putative naringenin-chalcone synthase [Dyadobacter jejuensis]|uniref:Putative naringenin-chalcone synthase n=1 Tax=Dyadobacter jejuensis TaxID=1082580 RepID=A0A316B960_9BACT|nr:type III polyketide synthase [Dyadobacter jejuensis]PWJ59077.1 putative naringenin-chalcone synthase [Dyadobacter jejuensis]
MSYISYISTAVPDYGYEQKQLADFYSLGAATPSESRKINIVSSKTGIDKRYSVLPDFSDQFSGNLLFGRGADKPSANLSDRMEVYRAEALKLSLKAVGGLKDFLLWKKDCTHLITVTCTGLFAPGLDIELIRELALPPNIGRSSLNFMGCNAAILALKNADYICKSVPDAKVLVLCTELCTLHFQQRFDDDYLLSNLLFADGAAAVLVTSQAEGQYPNPVRIDAFHSMIVHEGYKDMAWQLSESGFIMNLTSYVPRIIKENIKDMLDAIGLNPEEVEQWAVHPGGKKILEEFAKSVELAPHKLADAYEVLRSYGNMSSPTVLFVLEAILAKSTTSMAGQQLFSAAFGPGISIETMSLRYV